MEKISIKDIRATYSKDRMVWERKNKLWLYYAGRVPSFYLTWVFLRLNISANQTTFICLLIGLTSCIFLAFGSYLLKLIGGILMILYLALDCVDGDIARYTKSESLFGKFIDASGSYIVSSLLFVSIGVGAYVNPGSSGLLTRWEPIFGTVEKNIFLAAGFWSGFSYTLARLLSLRYKTLAGLDSDNDKLGSEGSSKLLQIGTIIFRNIFGVAGFFVPLLVLALALRLLGLLALFYGVVNTIALVFVLIKCTVKIRTAA